MTGVTKAQLQAVVESVIEQRLSSDVDVFIYDPTLIKNKLKDTGNYQIYGITEENQRGVLDKLAEDGSIGLDYLVEDAEKGQRWKYGHEWSIDHLVRYPDSGNAEDVLLQFFSSFIYLKNNEIRNLKIRYDLPFDAILYFEGARFTVDCDNGKYELPTMKSGKTVNILEYAWKHAGVMVTRDELNEKLTNGKPGKGSIKSFFKENKTIKDLLSPFILFTGDGIKIDRTAKISYEHLCKIISYTIEKGHIRE